MYGENKAIDDLMMELCNRAQIQLVKLGAVPKAQCGTIREGEWAAMTDEEGFWTRQIKIQFVNVADLRTFHRSVNGFSYNMGNGEAVIDVLPRGGWGVLAAPPPEPCLAYVP